MPALKGKMIKSRDMAETLRTLEKALLLELGYPTTAIRFWGNHESKNYIKIPSGKTFTLLNLPNYYAGFTDKYLDEG